MNAKEYAIDRMEVAARFLRGTLAADLKMLGEDGKVFTGSDLAEDLEGAADELKGLGR